MNKETIIEQLKCLKNKLPSQWFIEKATIIEAIDKLSEDSK